MVSSISSKKQTKTCRIVVKTNPFVNFLEEFMAFEICNWPLACNQEELNQGHDSKIDSHDWLKNCTFWFDGKKPNIKRSDLILIKQQIRTWSISSDPLSKAIIPALLKGSNNRLSFFHVMYVIGGFASVSHLMIPFKPLGMYWTLGVKTTRAGSAKEK